MEPIIVTALATLLAAVSAQATPDRSPAPRAHPAASAPTTSPAEWTVRRNYERFLREPRMQFQPSRHA